MYLIKKSDIGKIAQELSVEYDIYGPWTEKDTGQVMFDHIDDLSVLDLQAAIPAIPPKSVVFPQMECVYSYRYDRKAKSVSIKQESAVRPKALIGLRPCDLAGMRVLDRFFLGQEFVDDFYLTNRKKVFIVTNTCVKPFSQCFCVCTGDTTIS